MHIVRHILLDLEWLGWQLLQGLDQGLGGRPWRGWGAFPLGLLVLEALRAGGFQLHGHNQGGGGAPGWTWAPSWAWCRRPLSPVASWRSGKLAGRRAGGSAGKCRPWGISTSAVGISFSAGASAWSGPGRRRRP
ncbi:MAG: hypothetical protein HY717_06600 [Planctomycetes bacterium]|nr:hypothetical protein [Planctomycetota bacterium]